MLLDWWQAHGRNGAFVTTCICHGCDWARLGRGQRSAAFRSALGHFSDWYHGRTAAAAARFIDPRGPNGDGRLGRGAKEPGWANCSDGFYAPADYDLAT